MRGNRLEEESRELSLNRKMADRSFCHIIVPWYSIMLKEREKALSVANEALLILTGQIRTILLAKNNPFIEFVYVLCEFSKVSFLEPVLISSCKDRDKQISHFCNKRAKLIIK